MDELFSTEEEKKEILAKKNREYIAKYRQHLDKVKSVFLSDDGLYILDYILNRICGLNDSVFTGNSKSYYLSGKQDVGREIQQMVIHADIDIYHKLLDMQFAMSNKEIEK